MKIELAVLFPVICNCVCRWSITDWSLQIVWFDSCSYNWSCYCH